MYVCAMNDNRDSRERITRRRKGEYFSPVVAGARLDVLNRAQQSIEISLKPGYDYSINTSINPKQQTTETNTPNPEEIISNHYQEVSSQPVIKQTESLDLTEASSKENLLSYIDKLYDEAKAAIKPDEIRPESYRMDYEPLEGEEEAA